MTNKPTSRTSGKMEGKGGLEERIIIIITESIERGVPSKLLVEEQSHFWKKFLLFSQNRPKRNSLSFFWS